MSVRLSESVSDIGLFTVDCQLVEGETGRGHAYHTIRIRELQISDIHCSVFISLKESSMGERVIRKRLE